MRVRGCIAAALWALLLAPAAAGALPSRAAGSETGGALASSSSRATSPGQEVTAAPSQGVTAGPSRAGSGILDFVGRPISRLEIDCPVSRLRGLARNAIEQRVGDPYRIDRGRESLQNLYASGDFADARIELRDDGDGLVVTYLLKVRPRLHDIKLEGDVPGGDDRVRDALAVRHGDPLSAAVAAAQADRAQQALADQGYLQATVTAVVRDDGDPTKSDLVLRVEPGTRTDLGTLRLEGDTGTVVPARAKQALGLSAAGPYRPARLQQGLSDLRRLLVRERYFHARVRVQEQSLNIRDNVMDVVVSVDPGPRVEIDVTGLEDWREVLRERTVIYEFSTVEDWALKESRQQIVRHLQQRGHWRPLVTYSRDRDGEGRNVEVTFRILAGNREGLERVEFPGAQSIERSRLLATVRSRESGFLDTARFVGEWWEQDQEAVISLYRRDGFLEVRIASTEVRVDPELGGLRARMQIEEGPRTVVADVRMEVVGSPPHPGLDVDGLLSALRLQVGGPYSPALLRNDSDRLRSLLANAGYPRAALDFRADVEEHAAAVVHRVRPGRRVRIGRVLVAGNRKTREEVIRRELSFLAGSPYAFGDLLDGQSRLYRLGIFNQVDISSAVPDALSDERTVVVRVREAPRFFVSYGAGFDTEEGPRGLLSFGNENLLGADRSLSLSTRLSFREERVQLLLREPWFLGRRLEATLGAFYDSEQEESFDVQRAGGSFQVVLRQDETHTSSWRLAYRDVRTFDVQIDPALIERQDRDTRVGSVGYTFIRDTRPNVIDPAAGAYHTLEAELATELLGGESEFVRLQARSFRYLGLGQGVVLALGFRGGWNIPFAGDDSVPLPERFFIGGSTTLRGFGLDEGGPTDSAGNPVGGEVLLLGNAELRFPLRQALGGVIFLDVGNVFTDMDAVALARVRETLGFGLRYDTAVGPVRVDLGRLLDRREGEPELKLFVSVGHTF